jgi:hypothetical protein
MATITLTPFQPGETRRLGPVTYYTQDNAHNPSQIVDITTALQIGQLQNRFTVNPVTDDNRSWDITALPAANGTTTQVTVDVASPPALTISNRLNVNIQVLASPADDRRVDPPAPPY